MKSFFRALNKDVRYLLISGQACILYGASEFSEDIDLWVEPTAANLRRLIQVLARADARVYKLTPPMTERNARRGHGFHFVVRSDREEWFLDVMGKPPRVGSFTTAFNRARRIESAWGRIPVIAPSDLVRVKRTQRLADYEVISNLVRLCARRSPSKRIWRWAMENTFDAADLARYASESSKGAWPARKALRALAKGRESCEQALEREIGDFRRRDRAYWAGIIEELKRMRRMGTMIPEGTPVRAL